jgi:hypothetical protein
MIAPGSDLPHVVEESRELRHPLLVRVEPEPLGDREDELDDVPTVRAGVGVVRLDHVAEQYDVPWYAFFSSSTVSFFSRRRRDARDDQHHREQEQQRCGCREAGNAAEEPERCENSVECVGREHAPDVARSDRGTTARGQDKRGDGIEYELRDERGGVDREFVHCAPRVPAT